MLSSLFNSLHCHAENLFCMTQVEMLTDEVMFKFYSKYICCVDQLPSSLSDASSDVSSSDVVAADPLKPTVPLNNITDRWQDFGQCQYTTSYF